jgi:hypothetical protein
MQQRFVSATPPRAPYRALRSLPGRPGEPELRTASLPSAGDPPMKHFVYRGLAALLFATALPAIAAQEVVIGIGTQNTTTNTVTGGVVLKELKLLEKHLPKTGKYKDISFKLDCRTSPPARRSPTA